MRVIALGRFSTEVPPLAPRLAALGVQPLRVMNAEQLPPILSRQDVLLTEMDWLESLSPAQQQDLSRRAGNVAGWVAVCNGRARFKRQVEWLRAGVTHFFQSPLDAERLAGLLEDIHDQVAGPPLRVILIDDEESALGYYGRILEEAGIVVEATQDPLIVVETIEEFHPDLLVVDIEMPGCRGPELVAILRQRPKHKNLPVIFLTAMEGMADLLQARQAAAEDLLAKPVAAELLVAAVCSQGRRYRTEQRAEALHRQLELRARLRLEQLQMAIDEHAIVSAADLKGNIVYANDKFCAISGYRREELLGKNHRMIKSHEHPPEFFAELWRAISGGQVWHGELCNRSKDGTLYWVMATIAPVRDDQGRIAQYVSIRTDISRVKRAESALRILVETTGATANEAFFAACAEGLAKALGARVGFIAQQDPADPWVAQTLAFWDTDRLTPNFRYELRGSPCLEVLENGQACHPAGVAALFPEDAWLAENRLESYVGVRLKDSTGRSLGHLGILDDKPLPANWNGLPLLEILAIRVAAEMERRHTADNLRASEEKLRAILESTQDGILAVDQTGRVDLANRRFREMWHIPTEVMDREEDERRLIAYVHQQLTDPDDFLQQVRQIYGSSADSSDVIEFHDGRVFERYSTPLRGSGQPGGRVWSFHDVTDRINAERQAELHKERLRRSQLFANIGTWDWNIQTNEVFWSERIGPLLGYPEGEREPSFDAFMDVVHPDDRQMVLDAVNAAIEEDSPYEIEHRVLRHDGTARWLLQRGAVQRDGAGRPLHMLGITQDIDDRKRTQLALADSERQLREAQALAHLGHWDVDLLRSAVVWSEETFRIFGRDPANFVPDPGTFYAALHPEDIEIQRQEEYASNQSGRYDLVVRILRPDGMVRYVHNLGRLEFDGEGRVIRVAGTVQDVTERRLAELALAERERLLSAILSTTRQGFWFIDTNGITTEINPAMCEILGRSREEILGHRVLEFVDSENAEVLHQALEQRWRGLARPYELAITRPDGTQVVCINTPSPLYDQRGRLIGSVGLFTDISQLRLATDSLALFRRMFDVSEQLIAVADGQGRLIYQNQAHQRAFGYADAELVGQSINIFLTDDSQLETTEEILATLNSGRNWVKPLPLRRKDGSIFIAANNIGCVKDESGKIQYLFNIFSDVSAELARREELAQAKETAERANRAKSEFLSSMSHELRTPMNAIIGFAQMLEYDEALNADQQDNVQEILKGGRHLLELINEVLDLAKIEAGRIDLTLEPVDLVALAEDCQQLIQPLAVKRGIGMRIEVPAGAVVRADRVRLKQSLLNLLSNAVKYNREGGNVTVQVEFLDALWLRIEVRDTGSGIPQERLEEIFQPFNRLDAEYSEIEGTGIGLTITRRLVEMMGGRIGVESEVSQGSRFCIDLPRTEPNSHLQIDAPTPQDVTINDDRHLVLSIDDNPVNLKLITQILAMRPAVHLITAQTPEQGLELARSRKPDLILLDINMPGMSGYQLLELLKANEELKDTPVVAVTANAMSRDIERGRQAGFSDYLTKPLVIDQFLRTVDAHLNGPNKPPTTGA